jgi:hypothetical protein
MVRENAECVRCRMKISNSHSALHFVTWNNYNFRLDSDQNNLTQEKYLPENGTK